MPVVYVVRHPVAASLSRLESGAFYGLGDYLETPAGRAEAERSPAARWLPPYDRWRREAEPLVRLVAEWCIENAYPLGELERAGAEPVFYERIVADPVAELGRLGELCEPALGPPARAPSAEEARRPSAMDWRGGAAAARRSGDWRRHARPLDRAGAGGARGSLPRGRRRVRPRPALRGRHAAGEPVTAPAAAAPPMLELLRCLECGGRVELERLAERPGYPELGAERAAALRRLRRALPADRRHGADAGARAARPAGGRLPAGARSLRRRRGAAGDARRR